MKSETMEDARCVYPRSHFWPKPTQAPNGHGQSLFAGIPRVAGAFTQCFVIIYHTNGIMEEMTAKGRCLILGGTVRKVV